MTSSIVHSLGGPLGIGVDGVDGFDGDGFSFVGVKLGRGMALKEKRINLIYCNNHECFATDSLENFHNRTGCCRNRLSI